jgi:hypothetical protein
MKAMFEYLPEYEMFTYNTFDGRITPNIAIEDLTRKFLMILDVNHKPLVMSLSLIFGLI